MENKSINRIYLIFLLVFSVLFISVAYASFNSELNISGDISIFTDTTAPTCGTWYLRDSSLTIQDAYDQNKFINPSTNTNWTNTNKKLFIECSDNMSGSFGCINVTEITDSNNNKRYFKEVKEYTTSIKTDSEVVTVTLQDAYLNSRTCTLPVGGSNPYIDKQGPTVTITRSAANKFTYSATDDMSSNVTLQYMVTTSSTTPSLNDLNWSSTPSEVTIDNSAAHTYYVWAKDGVNITHQTISTYLLTKTQGTGTTLTLRYNNSTGATLSTGYVLNGTQVYAVATPSTGYNTAVLKKGSTTIATGTGTGNATSTQTISGATTISSSASANTYLVNYDANGGTGSMASQLMTYGTSTALSTNTFTKTGYTFAGWNTANDGTGTNYINGQNVSNLVTTNNGSITLYAKWTASTYTVTANANGGSIASSTGWTGTGNTSTKSVTYDSAYGTLPTVSKNGYVLAGWSLLPEGYTQVEYIESTGTQYINTEAQIFNKTSHEIVIDFEPTSFYNYNTIWGSTHDADTFEGWIYSNGNLASRYSNVRYGQDTTITVNERHKLDIYKNNTNLYMTVDGVNRSNNGIASTHSSTATLLLFLSGTDYGKYKLYGSQIYSEGELIRNFVPCVQTSTGKVGLYDLVNGVFYGNAATSGDDFTAGSPSYITAESIVQTPGNHNIYAKWNSNAFAITYDYAFTNYTFDPLSYIDTGYTIDWDRDFKLNQTFNLSTANKRYLIFGSYSSTNELNLEIINNRLRVYSSTDKGTYTGTLSVNTDIQSEFTYTASDKSFAFTTTGTNSNASVTGTNDKTGVGIKTLRIGNDYRGAETFNTPYTVKAASITDYYSYGDKLTKLPVNPTVPGYTFNGWFTALSGGTQVTTNTDVPSSDTTYYAHWTANTYTIAYAMNNGTNPSPKPTSGTYNSDVVIGSTSMPTKTVTITGNANSTGATIGSAVVSTQTFTGWTSSTAAGLGTSAKTGTSASPSTAWTGSATTNKYFRNLRDTSGTVTLTANWSGSVTLPTVEKTGYTCAWYDTEGTTGGNLIGTSGGSYTVPSNSATTVNIYARCTANTYTLTINPNGGTFNNTTSNTTVTQNYGTTYSVSNTPTKTGYTFTGWVKSGAGVYNYYDINSGTPSSTTVKNFDAANSAMPNVYNNNGNGTVTRSMVADSTATGGYSLNVVTNGSAQPGAGGIQLDINPTVADRINVLEIKAKLPTGYNIKIAGIGASYTGYGSGWRTYDYSGTGEWKTYYLVIYTGTTGNFGTRQYIYLDGSDNTSVSWNINSITMKSYTKDQFKSIYTFGAGDGTLTAQWSLSGSKVTWDKQGGTFGDDTIGTKWTSSASYFTYTTAYTGTKVAPYYISDSDFAFYKTGYTFGGWYTGTNGTGTQIFDATGKLNASVSGYSDTNRKWQKYDANVTLYAYWIPNAYTVTADANGGTIASTTGWTGTGNTATKTVTYDSAYGTLPTVSRTGYTFEGWYKLPIEFEKVDYLESTGDNILDIGTKFNSNTDKFELDYQVTDAAGNYFIAGSGWSSDSNYFWIYNYNVNGKFSVYIKDTSGTQRWFNGYNGTNTNRHLLTYDAKKLYMDGLLTTDNSSYTFGETPYNFSLFGAINTASSYNAKAKIYGFRMWRAGELTKDMIPVNRKSDNVKGLYDIVENKFYTFGSSATTGSEGFLTNLSTVITPVAHEITAQWTPNTYTIAYTMNNGSNPNPKPTSGIYDSDVVIGSTSMPTKTVTITGNANSTGATVGSAVVSTQTFNGWTSSTAAGLGTSAKTGTSSSPSTAWTGSATTNKYFKNLRDTSGTVTLTANWSGSVTLPTVEKTGYTCSWYDTEGTTGGNLIGTSGGSYTIPSNSSTTVNIYARCTPNTYTVTADANGGTIASTTGWTGTGNTSTKSVTYDAAYGTLPTVTRAGYTLVGWNGKNLINLDDMNVYSNWSATLATYGSYPTNSGNPGYLLDIENGETYTISYTTLSSSEFPPYLYLCRENGSATELVSYLTTTDIIKTTYTFTAENGYNYYLRAGFGSASTFPEKIATISSIQLEEGSTATTYEPYYITDLTTVTQAKDHTITAIWTPNTYSIVLDNQSATSAGTTKVWYKYKTVTDGCYYYTDSTLSTCLTGYTITKPTKTGYTFGGYYTSTGGSGTNYVNSSGSFVNNIYQKLPIEINSNYTDEISLYAKWTSNAYTIAYTMNNGTNPSPKPTSGTYNSDVAIGTTTMPTKSVTITPNVNGTGASVGSAVVSTQTFTGWTSSTAAGLGTGAKTGTAANPSTAWAGAATTNKYFKNLRDTSGTVTLTANWSGSVTLPTVTKTGHTCKWYDTEGTTGGNLIGNSGGSYTIPSNSATTVNIYARCTPNSYTLTVNANGGSWNGTTSNTTITQNYGTTYNVANNATRTGYIFGGWKLTSGEGNLTYFQDSEKVSQYLINSTSALKPPVYNWNSANNTVTHTIQADSTSSTGYSLKIVTNGEANPGAGGFYNAVNSTSGAIYYHKIVAKVPTGYNLIIRSNSCGVGYGNYWITDNTGTGDWETYIYAQYSGYNGPFSSLGYVNLDGTDNTNVTWYINESTIYRKGSNLSETQASNILFGFEASNATLTAIWNSSGATVTWDKQGGTFGNGTIGTNWTATTTGFRYLTAYSNTKTAPYYISDSDFAFYKTGYTFGGWYTGTNGTGTQVFDATGKLNASVSGYSDANRKWQKYDSNVTLYAKWIPNSYTITYDLHSGTNNANNPSSYTIESNDITLSVPTRSGYTFNGWTSNNLFDMNATPYQAGKYIYGNGDQITNASYSIYKVNVNPNTSYTIVNSGGSTSPGYAIYNSSDTRLAGANYANTKVITFTTPANASYILVTVVANYTAGDAYRYDKNIFELYETNGLTSTYDTYVTKTIPTGSMGDKSFTANWSKEMSDLTITLSSNSYTYDGSAKTPTVTVKDGSTTLTKDVDYKVSYSDNTNAGTGTVTITTLGAYNSTTKATYTGTTSKTFTINRQAITFPTCSDKAYTASEQTLFEAHSSGTYTNSVIKGTTVGEYTGTLTPASNYQWSTGDNVTEGRTLTCNIVKSNTTTTLANITNTYNGNNQAASGATAKLNSNNTSISGAAFTYKYYTNNLCNVGETTTAPKNAGTYYVKATLTGTDNYESSASNCATYTMNSKKTTITYNYNNAYQISFANGEYAETGYYIDWDNDFTISGVWKYPTAAKRYLVIGNNSDGTKTLNIEATTENKFRIYMGNGGAAADVVSSTTIGRNVDITYTYSWVASTHTYTFTATGTSTNISMTGTASSMTGVSARPLRYGTRDNTNNNSAYTTTTYHKTLNITKVYTADGTNTLDISTASKPAYTFNGWYTASTGGTAVSNETLVPATNTTYYAQWTPNTFQVKFNANGGSGTMANESFTFDQAKALTANAFVREGYTFVGWANNSTTGATSGIYYDGQSVSNLSKTNNATVNLYALWRSNGYQVVYDGNGNTSGSMSNQNMTYGTAGTLTANSFAKTGYTFNNWKTSTSATGVSYNNQASININPNMITGTSAPAALPTSSVTTGYAYSGRWARTSTSITPTIIDATDTPSSLITKAFNIPNNTTSANYYMYVQYMLVDYNQPYTLSVYAKGTGTLILRAGNSTPYKEETFTLTDTWTRYSMKVIPVNSNTAGTYNARTSGRYLHNIGFGTPAGNGAIQVAGVKFEIGDTATEYTDSNNTLNLHAQWTPTTYTIAYAMNNGNNPDPKPTSGTYNSDVSIGTTTAPTKSVTFTPNANGTDANMGSAVVSAQTFTGWSSSTSAGLGSNAKTGTSANPSTAWAGTTTTNKYFKNLRDTSGTVTLTANWSGSVTLPTVTKTGYTCKWYDTEGTTGGNLIGNSGASYTVPSNSATAVTLYARCTPNPLIFGDKTVTTTYNETSQSTITNGITAATGGTGSYTYTITGGNSNNYFSISGRNIVVAKNTPANANGYDITIHAEDNNSGAISDPDPTYKIIVNKATCPLTTSGLNLKVGDTLDLSTRANNAKGELSYAFKSGGRQTSDIDHPTTIDANGTLTAGHMSADNDTRQYVDVQITDKGTENYNGCTKDLVIGVDKKTNTLASNNHTVYVNSENNYSDLIKNNNGGELTATLTSDNTTGGVHDTTNKKYTAGVLSASNDNNGSVVFSVTSHRTTEVAERTVNSTLTVQKYTNTLAANNQTVYVNSTTALTSLIKNKNGGDLTATITKDNTAGSSISGSNFIAGVLSASNDNNQTVNITFTSGRTTTVKASGNVGVTVTVQKYTNALSWTGSTPANNATLGYGGSYTATATPANNGGTNGAITYTSGTTATMTIDSTTGAITVKKVDGSSSVITASMAATTTVKAATLTRTFKTGKGTCPVPTGLAVSTAGVVTWTQPSGATSSQISIDDTTYTAATSGINYNSTITASSGNRHVYVRSVCDTAYYTSAYSYRDSFSVIVGRVKLIAYDDIDSLKINNTTVTSNQFYNFISNSSISISATPSTGYTWDRWTGNTVTTANPATVLVGDSDKTFYANTTPNTYTVAYAMNNGTNPNPKPTSGTYDEDVEIGTTSMPTKTITVSGNANGTGATVGSAVPTAQTFAGWTSSSSAGLGSGAYTDPDEYAMTDWDGSLTTNQYFRNLRDTSGTVTLTANWTGDVNLPTVTKTGYTCKWYSSTSTTAANYIGESGGTWSTVPNNSSTSVTLYAGCEINSYTLTINPNGGSYNGTTSNTTVTQNYGTMYSNIGSNPTKAGYIFNGWTFSGAGTFGPYYSGTDLTDYNSFNYNSSSSTLPSVYNNGTSGAVTRQMVSDSTAYGGYSLKVTTNGTASPGAGGINVAGFPTTPGRINVVQVYAKIPTGYTLKLNGIGEHYTGVGSEQVIATDNTGKGDWYYYQFVVYAGDAGNFQSNVYLYLDGSNNTSVTWNVSEIDVISYTKDQFKSYYTFGAGNGTLTANWNPGGAKVTFNINGGYFDSNIVKNWTNGFYNVTSTTADRYYLYNTAYINLLGYDYAPAKNESAWRDGYTLDGWYTSASGGTKVFDANGRIVAGVSGYSDSSGKWIKYDSNVTLYAHWNPNTITITLNSPDGYFSGTTTIYEKYADAFYRVNTSGTLSEKMTSSVYPITKPRRIGYSFDGYYTQANGGGTQIINANGYIASSANLSMIGSLSYDLYAKWTANTYTVNANANGGTLSTATTGWSRFDNGAYGTRNVTFDSTFQTVPTPTRSGYTFEGWYNNSDKNLGWSAGTSNYSYKRLAQNLVPGATYTVKIGNAIRTEGTATKFTVMVYNHTTGAANDSRTYTFTNNLQFNVSVPESWSSGDDISIIIYAGQAGTTSGNKVTYSNMRVSSSNLNGGPYTGSSVNKIPGYNYIYAHWD